MNDLNFKDKTILDSNVKKGRSLPVSLDLLIEKGKRSKNQVFKLSKKDFYMIVRARKKKTLRVSSIIVSSKCKALGRLKYTFAK